MLPIHPRRIFRSPREYFICHAPKTYLLNAYFFYLLNVYNIFFFISSYSAKYTFYQTKLRFKKCFLNFRLKQMDIGILYKINWFCLSDLIRVKIISISMSDIRLVVISVRYILKFAWNQYLKLQYCPIEHNFDVHVFNN